MVAPKERVNFYSNGISVKIPNRRISVYDYKSDNNCLVIEFKNVDDSPEIPRVIHKVERKKIAVSSFKISKEAAYSLIYCLLNRLGLSEVRIGENGLECLTSELNK